MRSAPQYRPASCVVRLPSTVGDRDPSAMKKYRNTLQMLM